MLQHLMARRYIVAVNARINARAAHPAVCRAFLAGRRTVAALCAALSVGLAGCSFLLERDRYVDPRTEWPVPVIFDEEAELPGGAVAAPSELDGIWFFRMIERGVRVDEGLSVPLLYYSLILKLDSEGSYELVYYAYWGARGGPNMRAVDVRESGRFSLTSNALRLESASTELTQLRSGQLATRTLGNENREYRAALDGAYLNIAGPCASYQVEPICLQDGDVRYALRLSLLEWPVPPLSTPSSTE